MDAQTWPIPVIGSLPDMGAVNGSESAFFTDKTTFDEEFERSESITQSQPDKILPASTEPKGNNRRKTKNHSVICQFSRTRGSLPSQRELFLASHSTRRSTINFSANRERSSIPTSRRSEYDGYTNGHRRERGNRDFDRRDSTRSIEYIDRYRLENTHLGRHGHQKSLLEEDRARRELQCKDGNLPLGSCMVDQGRVKQFRQDFFGYTAHTQDAASSSDKEQHYRERMMRLTIETTIQAATAAYLRIG